jgi:DNA-binding LacI/PurR family transcriptional regulator
MSGSTVKDIAKNAGVSTATVSRVLNGDARTSARARIAVMNAISALRYVPNLHAMELGRTNSGKKRANRKNGVPRTLVNCASESSTRTTRIADNLASECDLRTLEKENANLKRAVAQLKLELMALRSMKMQR